MLNKLAKVAATLVLVVSAVVAANAQSIKGIVTLPGLPEGIAVNYLTNRVYVAIPSFGGPSDSVAIIDGKSDTVIGSVSIPPVGQSVAVDVVRDLIYVGGSYFDVNGIEQSEVVVVNGRSRKVRAVIPVTTTPGAGVQGLAVNPFSGEVYVANASDNVVDVIREGCDKVTNRISVSESPFGVALNPFTNQVYVALSDGTVDVIDGRKQRVTITATIGSTNAGIAANLATGDVFVTDNQFGPSTVGVLDRKGNVLANIPVGNTPFGVDVDFVTNLAFVTNTQDGTVSVIDGKTMTATGLLPVTGLYIAVNPVTQKVYVGGQDNSVTVLKEK
jgi:YVTN family beta-propeller protein